MVTSKGSIPWAKNTVKALSQRLYQESHSIILRKLSYRAISRNLNIQVVCIMKTINVVDREIYSLQFYPQKDGKLVSSIRLKSRSIR